MKIITISGVGIGSSGVLKVNTERVLARLGFPADVVAVDLATLPDEARDAQVILASAEFVDAIGKTNADVIVIDNAFDGQELATKLEAALGT